MHNKIQTRQARSRLQEKKRKDLWPGPTWFPQPDPISTQADTNALAVTAHGASPGLLTLLPDSYSSVSLQ
ncbi:Dicer-like protein 2 [Fusarium oxysporum f. sp. albedinis]|nr:Dicer-like protein 2 [Fusarium oxysporum f. sp. albedinis]